MLEKPVTREVGVASPAARMGMAAALVFWCAIGLLPPARLKPLPSSAPLTEFSAERAMNHVRAIAQRPHPRGSNDILRVRAYIINELSRLGVTPELETGYAKNPWRPSSERLPVTNVLARLAGVANKRAFMLSAHFDSVARGPGAADDAAGVAALLETLRALRSG